MIFSAVLSAARRVLSGARIRLLAGASIAAVFFFFPGFLSSVMRAQQTDPAPPVVVQPGAPGKPSKMLPPSTRAKLPPRSQADVEFMQGMIKFMQRWLAARGEAVSMSMPGMQNMNMAGHAMPLMPGMLTPEQMEALRKAKGVEFDHLFLTGMIQHHDGALTMVKELFDKAGAGQDADVFNFATDADNTQRAEIKIMQNMLDKKSLEEKR